MAKEVPRLALYRKYRSRDFSELIGQPHVTGSLANAIKNGRISHAYLFAGPRGVGKTTAARIFAHQVNGLKAEDSVNHLDIIEIDAASNRRIDEIRDLREKIHIAPTAAKYKVYIIDEAHMLTTEAFNALLKTLEEPPAHAIFILATTEFHKLPETIISRTQRFNFRPVSEAQLAAHLKTIAAKEKFKIDDDALSLIAAAGEGSVRDSISLLDQVGTLAGEGKIDGRFVREVLGLTEATRLDVLTSAMSEHKVNELLAMFDAFKNRGLGYQQVIEQLLKHWEGMIRQTADPQLLGWLRQLSALPIGLAQGWYALEATLLQLALPDASTEPPVVALAKEAVAEVPAKLARPVKLATTPTAAKGPPKLPGKAAAQLKLRDEIWLKVLSIVKQSHNSLYALLRTGEPSYDPHGQTLTMSFRFQFHKRRLEEGRNRRLLETALEEVFGTPVSVTAEVAAPAAGDDKAQDQANEDDEALKSVLEIMGGEVVNE